MRARLCDSPYLYLHDPKPGQPNTIDNIIDYHRELLRRCRRPMIPVIPSPCYGSEERDDIPGCHVEEFTFQDGTTRKFGIRDEDTWREPLTKFYTEVRDHPGVQVVVAWVNDGRIYGPAPKPWALKLLQDVFG
jgi:hypothetical protein